jgi:hypothetical protein
LAFVERDLFSQPVFAAFEIAFQSSQNDTMVVKAMLAL